MESAADVLDNLPLGPVRNPGAGRVATGAARAGGTARIATIDLAVDPAPPEARSQVLALLSPEPTMVDDIVRRCQLSPPVTVAVLLELELAGRVETLPGNRVALLPGGSD